jgi:hypothetical protein
MRWFFVALLQSVAAWVKRTTSPKSFEGGAQQMPNRARAPRNAFRCGPCSAAEPAPVVSTPPFEPGSALERLQRRCVLWMPLSAGFVYAATRSLSLWHRAQDGSVWP